VVDRGEHGCRQRLAGAQPAERGVLVAGEDREAGVPGGAPAGREVRAAVEGELAYRHGPRRGRGGRVGADAVVAGRIAVGPGGQLITVRRVLDLDLLGAG